MSVTDLKAALPLLWFFPYFMEPKMKEYIPDLTMLDYKVCFIFY